MADQQSNSGNPPGLAISPSMLVGIVILAAFAIVIIFASLFRYCRRNKSITIESDPEEGGSDTYNPNRPRPASQVARMKEVRSINTMYAWERGRRARIEIGEVRPTTMIAGRAGQSKNWDEYTIADDAPMRAILSNPFEDPSGATDFYNVDDPYARTSRQGLHHLAPPSSARNSYQTCSSDYNPRHQSVLLPQPIQREPIQRSSLRHEYLAQEPPAAAEVTDRTQNQNPKITINDETQDIATSRSPAAHDANFEVIPLDTGGDYTMYSNFASTEPFADLQALPLSHSINSVSVYDDDDDHTGYNGGYGGGPSTNEHPTAMINGTAIESSIRAIPQETQQETMPRDGVKGLVQEWERVNGRFARMY